MEGKNQPCFLIPELLGQQRNASWFIMFWDFSQKEVDTFFTRWVHPVCFSLGLRPGEVGLPLHFDWAFVLAHPSLRCRLHLHSASSPVFTCVLRLLLPLVAPVVNQGWVPCWASLAHLCPREAPWAAVFVSQIRSHLQGRYFIAFRKSFLSLRVCLWKLEYTNANLGYIEETFWVFEY